MYAYKLYNSFNKSASTDKVNGWYVHKDIKGRWALSRDNQGLPPELQLEIDFGFDPHKCRKLTTTFSNV